MSKNLHDMALAYHKEGMPGKIDVSSHKTVVLIKNSSPNQRVITVRNITLCSVFTNKKMVFDDKWFVLSSDKR